MWNPLTNNLSDMKIDDLVTKINDLMKRMKMTTNPGVRWQLTLLYNQYHEEYQRRLFDQMQKDSAKFDKIINIE